MSEDVLPWFPCRASKLIGALVALPHDEQVVYNMVLLRIYEKGGPVDESVTALARRTDTPKRRIETALDSLIRKGKIERLENGLLDSKSTHETLHEISAKKVLTKRAAKTRWEKPQQKQQKSDADAMLQTETETETEESPLRYDSSKIDLTTSDSSTKPETGTVVDLFGVGDSVPIPRQKQHINGEQLRFFGEQWNALASDLKIPEIDQIKSGGLRERHALARMREMAEDLGSVEVGVRDLLQKIRASPFLRGEEGGFRLTFDWIVNPTNYQKIMEGNYEARKKQGFRN